MYTVFDTAASAYLQPFFTTSTGLAIRSFQDAINDPNHQFSKHYTDYVLYLLGEFDDVNASFVVRDPVKIASGIEVHSRTINAKPAE